MSEVDEVNRWVGYEGEGVGTRDGVGVVYEAAESEEERSPCVVSRYEVAIGSPTGIAFGVSLHTSCGSEPDENSDCSPDCHGFEELTRPRESAMSLASPNLQAGAQYDQTSKPKQIENARLSTVVRSKRCEVSKVNKTTQISVE